MGTAGHSSADARPVAGATTPAGFRLDIQGIRGVALVLVLACHARFPHAEGGFVGLDVFYVLSGFLITGLILTEVRRTGRVSLLRFYARRARRLLPLVVTVLATITVVGAIVFGPVRAYEVSRDVIAASLYFVNWRFMSQAVDYFAFQDPDVSPVQHFWSLSVEEQFYLLWPAVVLVVAVLAARLGRRPKPLLWAVLLPAALASFAYGVWFSAIDPNQAYFSTLARGWELGLGCVLALALPAGLRLPRALSTLLVGGGVAALVLMTVGFANDIPYPGWYALVPTLATAGVIVGGTATRASLPTRLLSLGPLQYLGRISYAWYLWHWPALVFTAALVGRPLRIRENVAVTLAAWVPTIISHHLIEERFRRSRGLARRPRRALALGLACTAAAAALGVGLGAVRTAVPVARANESVGAGALEQGEKLQRHAKAIRPDLRHAEEDRGRLYDDGCHLKNDRRTDSPPCVYGDRRAKTSVVLLGDSHGLQYFPALRRLARHRGWRLTGLSHGGCTIASVDYKHRCDEWRESSLRRIERERPDLVVVASATGGRYQVKRDGTRLDREASEPLLTHGFAHTLRRIKRAGAKVAVIRDQARVPFNPAHCVGRHLDDLARCSFHPHRSGKAAYDAHGARRVKHVRLIDPLPFLCPDKRCPSVVGNVLVYRNTYHLTATFSWTLAPWLGRHLPKP